LSSIDPETKGVVLKPQFDLSVFLPGTAVHVKSIKLNTNDWYKFDFLCLVKYASPLTLGLVYIRTEKRNENDEDGHEYHVTVSKEITLPIESVSSGSVSLELVALKVGSLHGY
jgi:hypothetical protein